MNVMTQTPKAVTLGDKGLTLSLVGGDAYFNYFWLRDNDPTSFNSKTRERSFDIFHMDEAPRALAAVIEAEDLVITWAGEDHITRMPLEWLSTYAAGTRRRDPADLPAQPGQRPRAQVAAVE